MLRDCREEGGHGGLVQGGLVLLILAAGGRPVTVLGTVSGTIKNYNVASVAVLGS